MADGKTYDGFNAGAFASTESSTTELEKKMKTPATVLAAAIAAAIPSLAFASCGASFCTVNTNWTTQSAMLESGSSFDLRYEYMDQDQPYAGSERVAFGQVHRHHDEQSTVNRNVVGTYSRNFGNGWGVEVTVPVVQRDHQHVHNHHGTQIHDAWDFTSVGDVRVVGRYQFAGIGNPLSPSTTGVNLGLKLPTGRTGIDNADSGTAERSLQPGTGTTDLVLGAFHHQKLSARDASWFAQARYQHALNSRDNFKPGAQFGADLGFRQGMGAKWGLLAQLNCVHKRADSGSEAEPADSGSRALYASPGVSYAVGRNMQVYAFYQHALYRKVTGVQLGADRGFVAGVSGHL